MSMPLIRESDGAVVAVRYSFDEVKDWLSHPNWKTKVVQAPVDYQFDDGFNFYLVTNPMDPNPWDNADIPKQPPLKEGFETIFAAIKPSPTGNSQADRGAVKYWRQTHRLYQGPLTPINTTLPRKADGKKMTKASVDKANKLFIEVGMGQAYYYTMHGVDWARWPESNYIDVLPDYDVAAAEIANNVLIVIAQYISKLRKHGIEIEDPTGLLLDPEEGGQD